MMTIHSSLIVATTAALSVFAWSGPAHALTMKECSAKYRAAKAEGTLKGQSWGAFRKAECGPEASAAPSAPSEVPRGTTGRGEPSSSPSTARAAGSAVFPSSVSAKYSGLSAGKARMQTCLDQYRANKTADANGGLRWIQKGGGYYSECNKRLGQR
jgi:hypothetical protein